MSLSQSRTKPTHDTNPPTANTNEDSTTNGEPTTEPTKKKAKKEAEPTAFRFTKGSSGYAYTAVPIPIHTSKEKDSAYERYVKNLFHTRRRLYMMWESQREVDLVVN